MSLDPGDQQAGQVRAGHAIDPLAVAEKLTGSLNASLLGKSDVVTSVVAAVLSGGHLLLEDLPGTGKTLLGKAIAAAIGGSFARVQCTPDVLPSDITGTTVFTPTTGEWSFRPGPLFANVVLIDEINRATPRTQSALLEPMEEGQVTVDGSTWSLPDPHLFVATQNPHGHSGTFPLPESQLDRFSLVTSLGRPDRGAEHAILSRVSGPQRPFGALMSPDDLVEARHAVAHFTVTDALTGYVLDLLTAIRSHPPLAPGPSTRAGPEPDRARQGTCRVSWPQPTSPSTTSTPSSSTLCRTDVSPKRRRAATRRPWRCGR